MPILGGETKKLEVGLSKKKKKADIIVSVDGIDIKSWELEEQILKEKGLSF